MPPPSLAIAFQPLNWRAWPAQQRPAHALLAIGIIAGLTAAAWVAFGPLWAAVVPPVMVLSLNRFFFPSRFEVNDRGVTARYLLRTQRMSWDELRRFAHDDRGGYLSRRARVNWLDAYSGMHLIWPEDADHIIAAIRQRMPRFDPAACAITTSEVSRAAAD